MKSKSGLGIRIGDWFFDPESNQLYSRDAVSHLDYRCGQVLRYLVESRSKVVSNQELLDECWKGRIVGANSVAQVVSALRRAFGDNNARERRYIATIPRRGYRLVADVQEAHHARPTLEATQVVVVGGDIQNFREVYFQHKSELEKVFQLVSVFAEQHNGRMVWHDGDEFVCEFGNFQCAVAYAVELQLIVEARALKQYAPHGPVRMRMGITSGTSIGTRNSRSRSTHARALQLQEHVDAGEICLDVALMRDSDCGELLEVDVLEVKLQGEGDQSHVGRIRSLLHATSG